MAYKIIEHTADIGLWAEGKDLPELFSAAMSGMMEIMSPGSVSSFETSRQVTMESSDRTALLVDFLNEILFLSENNAEFYERIVFFEMGSTYLRAEIFGRKVNIFHKNIKAATYHGAEIKKNESGNLETEIIFDI